MASTIMLVQKKSPRNSVQYFGVIDEYIKSQGFTILDNVPKTYFIEKNIPPNKVKEYVNVIKATNGYKDVVQAVFYAPNMIKA